VWAWVKDRSKALGFLFIALLTQLVPWMFVSRAVFIYHYFASVPFIILATAWIAGLLLDGRPRLRRWIQWGFVALSAVFFVLFYPYASGVLTPTPWLDAMKWFPGIYY